MIRVELTEQEAQVPLEMITKFNWAGPNLEATEKHVATAVALQEKFAKALEGAIREKEK